MRAFHAATWSERAELVETFEDDRLREFGRRIVFFECPEVLHRERRGMLEVWLRNRLHGREGIKAGRTVPRAIEELEKVEEAEGGSAAVAAIRHWMEGLQTGGVQ